jgi:nitroimidazol reductase NimA-like FMN-containing flavoprotein (pyridoxamine 5'-phosphate oxidase superfamily)
LRDAELFWISTTRHDGRPHVTPLPAVWRDGALHFCTGPTEQKAVNLARDPHCVLTTGNNAWKSGLDVMVEGAAQRVTSEDRLRVLANDWETKYDGDWEYEVADHAFTHEGGEGVAYVYEVAPDKVLAFAKGTFAQTRYRFGA